MDISGNTKNKEIANKYLQWFSKNYNILKHKYRRFCTEKDYEFDEDVFSDTYVSIYNAIVKKGLKDTSDKGFDNYTFKSFKQNIQREKQYCRVSKRDMNITSDNVFQLYDEWYNEENMPEKTKLLNDLWKDFATLYILMKVEDNWDSEHFLLFKLKYLVPQMTYKKLQEKTQAKKCRQKVVNVKNWVRENVKKQEIKDAFTRIYGDFL